MARSSKPGFRIVSAIPGRVRVQFERLQDRSSLLRDGRNRLQSVTAVLDIREAAHASSLIVHYDRASVPISRFVDQIVAIIEGELGAVAVSRGAGTERRPSDRTRTGSSSTVLSKIANVARALWHRAPGQTEILHPLNLANDRPSGFKPLVTATIAMAFAAFEAIPLAITATALALATIPIAKRAAKGLGKRQLTVDELDFLNILLVALGGQFLIASLIAWLVSAGEVVRGKTVGYSRQSIARLLPPGRKPLTPEDKSPIEHLYTVELSNSLYQDEAMRCGNVTAYPLFVLAIVLAIATRDVTMIISILKPRADYTAGLRLGIPVPILNSLIAARGHGPFITSAAALEQLTLLDAVLVTADAERGRADDLKALETALAERGIRLLPLDDPGPGPAGSLLQQLTASGFSVGVIGTSRDQADFTGSGLRIMLDSDPNLDTAGADVYLMESGLAGLVTAVDIAFEAARISKQNTGLFAGAALTNLVTGALRLAPPPISSLINAVTMSAAAANSIRPLRALPRSGDVRRLREVLPDNPAAH